MAIFILKGKKGAGTLTREAEGIVIGTRSSCALSIEDPLAAEEHCAIVWSSEGFTIEDLGSSSGTYVNGSPVEGRRLIESGNEIVLGVSKIKVEIDLAKKQITLTLKEKDFFYDKKEDPLAWVRSEVSFGKFPPVRIANLFAILLGLASLPFLLWGRTSEKFADPGPLCLAHQQAMNTTPGAAGCQACHDSFRGTPSVNCAQCHASIMKDQHPFGNWESQDCLRCHTEHRGTLPGVVTRRKAESTCLECHGEKVAQHTPAPVKRVSVPIAYNNFSHKDHVQGQGIACAQCHQAAAGTINVAGALRDYPPVKFDTCMKCHAESGSNAQLAKKTFKVAWHGTDQGEQNCLRCHQELHQAALRKTKSAKAELLFSVKTRGHEAEFAAHTAGSSDACVDCHRDGVVRSTQTRSEPFWHGTHLASLAPATNDASGSKCLACHREQEKAEKLAADFYRGAEGDCSICHRNAKEEPLKPVLMSPQANSTTAKERNEFPHAAHTGKVHSDLVQGCFACHQFTSRDPSNAKASTLEPSQSCLPCHKEHRDLGGGSCYECHREKDPVYSKKTVPKEWPAETGFSHRSRGHSPLVEKGQCSNCHNAATETAKTILEVPIPDETQQSCRDCHLKEKTRFHWR